MKLRIEKRAVKFRLSTSEIEQLMDEKKMEQKLSIGKNNHFSYQVILNENIAHCEAAFEPYSLTIRVPLEKAIKWSNSKQIGIKETFITDKNESFVLILEEDLPPRRFKKD